MITPSIFTDGIGSVVGIIGRPFGVVGSALLDEYCKVADAKANLLRNGVMQSEIDEIISDTSSIASTLQRLEAKLDRLHGKL